MRAPQMDFDYRAGRPGVDNMDRCRRLRRETTDAERALWSRLRGRQLAGAKFRRQHEFGPFVLDFFCPEHRLAVEVDGGQHYEPEQVEKDRQRTIYLESHGLRVMRFSNREVLLQPNGVAEAVFQALKPEETSVGPHLNPMGPHPNPLPEGEGVQPPRGRRQE